MAVSASLKLRIGSQSVSQMWEERGAPTEWSGAIALDYRSGQAYNEEAFRYFLELERKRAEASNRPLLLLLVDLQAEPGSSGSMEEAAVHVFAGLTTCLRDTDFVGWYHEKRVVGAVLTQRIAATEGDSSHLIDHRVRSRLRGVLPGRLGRELQVRVFQLSSRAEG